MKSTSNYSSGDPLRHSAAVQSTVSRRDVIKTGAVAATGVALGQALLSPVAAQDDNQAAHEGPQRNMRAAQMKAHGEPLQVIDVPVPKTPADGALVRVEACGWIGPWTGSPPSSRKHAMKATGPNATRDSASTP